MRQGAYAVLDLNPPPSESSDAAASEAEFQRELKRAYNYALRRYHPDKNLILDKRPPPQYTIDEVKAAYQTLASPVLRSAVPRASTFQMPSMSGAHLFQSLDRIDLDDMLYSPAPPGRPPYPPESVHTESHHTGDNWVTELPMTEDRGWPPWGGTFSAVCPRCCYAEGIVIHEAQLAQQDERQGLVRDGFVLVHCQGCSLRVIIEYLDTKAQPEEIDAQAEALSQMMVSSKAH